ncbi:MAG: DUF4159 domain-containing protein [Bryobacterales bacterium]|nr:DUF4159 domain-containing protein [Bryobacterales bacterium]
MTRNRLLAVAALAGMSVLVAMAAAQGLGIGRGRFGGGRFEAEGGAATRGQTRWAQYEYEMQNPMPDPPDAWEERDFVFARLRFRAPQRRSHYQSWGIDANKSDRQFIQVVQRLTRVDARSVEEIVDVDSDDIFRFPFLYAVSVGDWEITDPQAARLREYFARGGFLMVDDFHAEEEWAGFAAVLTRVFPNGDVIDLPNSHPIFHTVYDLSERVRIPGLNVVHGRGVERGGEEPHWRAVVDAEGRVMVAICHNMDVADAWEWADLPEYPERFATEAYKLGINYMVYSLTH